jgi:hypothetical protein
MVNALALDWLSSVLSNLGSGYSKLPPGISAKKHQVFLDELAEKSLCYPLVTTIWFTFMKSYNSQIVRHLNKVIVVLMDFENAYVP